MPQNYKTYLKIFFSKTHITKHNNKKCKQDKTQVITDTNNKITMQKKQTANHCI